MTGQEPRSVKHSVLLVDDEPEILFSLKGLLRRDFQLFTAESGAEALKILEEHPIHVVMTDQRMPGMTGVELMGRVRTEHPEAIRIVFTGYADIKAVIEAINNGGLFRYITKPWDPDDLIETLHEAASEYDRTVEHRRLLNEVRDCLAKGQSLAQSPAASAAAEDQRRNFQQTASALLERIEQFLKG
jgi:DNA-binding NtrC family response regulator